MHPILFHIGGFPIRSWGVMVSLGVLAGTMLAYRLAKREGFDGELIYDYVIYAIVAGILGARVWEVIFSWKNYLHDPVSAQEFWAGGLSVQGMVAGGVLVTIWFVRKHRLGFWRFADVLAPGLILGQAIGRIGCLLNGDAYGIPTNSWFGVVYKPGSPAFDVYGATPLVPAELMEGAGDLLILGVLLYLLRRKPFAGFIALLYFILYSALRFTLEFWRGDSLMVSGGLKAAQMASVLIAVVAAGIMVVKWRRQAQ